MFLFFPTLHELPTTTTTNALQLSGCEREVYIPIHASN